MLANCRNHISLFQCTHMFLYNCINCLTLLVYTHGIINTDRLHIIHVLHRPLPPRVQETKSVSEGEVPLSPGDARWKIHIPKEGTPKRGVHDKGIKNVRNKSKSVMYVKTYNVCTGVLCYMNHVSLLWSSVIT